MAAKKAKTAKAAETGADTVTASSAPEPVVPNQDDPNLFNGADPALFDHDGDGHAGGSLPMAERDPPDYPPEQPPPTTVHEGGTTRQSPSVGHIVHFYENSAQEQPLAAIVNSVDPEFGIKLTVFRQNVTVPVSSFIPHLDDLTADGPCWVWPPHVPTFQGTTASAGSLADKFPGATGPTVFGVPK